MNNKGRLLVSCIGLGLGFMVSCGQAPRPRASTRALPPIAPSTPLPQRSERNASYTIEARLDTQAHAIDGKLVLEWRNTSRVALDTFPFHLYWNAYRNTVSTLARHEGWLAPQFAASGVADRDFGHIHVSSIRLMGPTQADLHPTLRYIQPDDGNTDDRTVMEVRTPTPVAPGETARFEIAWTSRLPHGSVGRAGWVHDYHFVAQWFPKIGVYWKGAWNCHQFHSWTEFFADYGVYDVKLNVPRGFVVGATGRLLERVAQTDGTETHHFLQEDVHDFTWTASRRFLERRARFEEAGYPSVDIRLLLQPEHHHLAERYVEAAKLALKSYGAWSAPYPYPQVTVVDPAWGSASGGMEYPTLFTGGADILSPPVLQRPEGVTIHEAGHQFWYGLVGNNEFEEAWLDEGFNSYHDEKTAQRGLGPRGWGKHYFGVAIEGGRPRAAWPVVAPGVFMARGEEDLSALRKNAKVDVMARPGWTYRVPDSYWVNSYVKPALTLQTLEAYVGDETMTRILRTYAARYRFGHPATRDFIAVVNEVTGQDYGPSFDQTWFSSDVCDYAVTVRNEPAPAVAGFVEGRDGRPALIPSSSRGPKKRQEGPFESEVTILRLGEVRLPVDVLIEFSDGSSKIETWDGQYRWKRFNTTGPAKVRRAVVDPGRKLAIDINPGNNSWVDEKGASRRAACKWAARWMFWLQNLLELHTLLG